MRRAALVLALAAAAAAQERELLEERFGDALRAADEALAAKPGDERLLEQRAKALRGLARDAQRRDGYGAALALLERELSHRILVQAYADVAVWAGEEERALRTLRSAGVPERMRLEAELMLLGQLGRFREAEARAREAGWTEWEAWERERAELRARLGERRRRAAWVAWVALAALLLGAAALFRLAPARAPARAAARGG